MQIELDNNETLRISATGVNGLITVRTRAHTMQVISMVDGVINQLFNSSEPTPVTNTPVLDQIVKEFTFDKPPAIIVEGVERESGRDCVFHGPFPDEDTAVEWAAKNIKHSEWHCAPLHKGE